MSRSPRPADAARPRAERARITVSVAAGLLALQLAWILALIPSYGIDEFDHIVRADAVAAGHWRPGTVTLDRRAGRGELQPVRPAVLDVIEPACTDRPYTRYYNCHGLPGPDGTTLVTSAAARYNPLFYAVAGTAGHPFDGNRSLTAMRIATAVLSTLLVALATWLLTGVTRSRWPLAALLLALTPTTVYSTAVVAPNGPHLVAGIGLWVALLALLSPGAPLRRTAYASAAGFSVVLLNTHALGALWLVLTLLALCVVHRPRALVRALLPRGVAEWALLALTAGAAVLAAGWLAFSGASSPSNEQTVVSGSPWPDMLRGLVLWPLQAVAAAPMRNEPGAIGTYAIFLALIVVLLLIALRTAGLRSRVAAGVLGVAATSYLVAVALSVRAYAEIGDAWQGRYAMPFAVGILLLSGWRLDESSTPRLPAWPAVAGAVAVVAAHLLTVVHVTRTEAANPALVEATGWHRPSTLLLALLGLVAAAAWSGALGGLTTRPRRT